MAQFNRKYFLLIATLSMCTPAAFAQSDIVRPARPAGLVVVETVLSPLTPNIILPKTAPLATPKIDAKTGADITTETITNAAAKEAAVNAETARITANASGTIIEEVRQKGQPTGLQVNTGFSQYALNGSKATSHVPSFGPVRTISVPMWSVFGW
jgi:hypothetical protein